MLRPDVRPRATHSDTPARPHGVHRSVHRLWAVAPRKPGFAPAAIPQALVLTSLERTWWRSGAVPADAGP